MTLLSITSLIYQKKSLQYGIYQLPLSARSLLIKQCQAQYNIREPVKTPIPTLIRLLDTHPDHLHVNQDGTLVLLRLRHYLNHFLEDISDPLNSAIILDMLRGLPLSLEDVQQAKISGWCKEIKLALGSKLPDCDFTPFFSGNLRSVHPDLPYQPVAYLRIRQRFRLLRDQLIQNMPYFYPRATHKNMSRSTRRDFENHFGADALEGIQIFGQDDWARVYHEHGILLEGECELRQKWYPSGAKPRTYACMGGTAYRHCRHLQDFFTALADLFPPTNHRTRLQPERLSVPSNLTHPGGSFRIYDMSAFTSNMRNQKAFCDALASFLSGVFVTLVDERDGLVERDLGELLRDYNIHCVQGPWVSLERTPSSLGVDHLFAIQHGIASLLGIFGNLMTCTVAHYLLVCGAVETDDEINVAGDDGIVLEFPMTTPVIDVCLEKVGETEPSKAFSSLEEGAICLKRPLVHGFDLQLIDNIIPPTLVTAYTYLSGSDADPRFFTYGLDKLTVSERLSIVGRDLFRFIRSAYKQQYPDVARLSSIWGGFARAAGVLLHLDLRSYMRKFGERDFVFWPLDPGDYDFYSTDPYWVWCLMYAGSRVFHVRRHDPIDVYALRYSGELCSGNSSSRLSLLKRLDYVDSSPVCERLDELQSPWRLYRMLAFPKTLDPEVYQFSCLRDIPVEFLF